MNAPLMISVAGVRGIVGETLTPEVASRFAAAFARGCPPGAIVIGRDARPTGPMIRHAVVAGLQAAGRSVIDLGLATTPTVEIAVERLGAAGGVILTASHNPSSWNALKFLSGRGEFLGPVEGRAVRERFESGAGLWVDWSQVGGERVEDGALDWHIDLVLGLACLDLERIRARRLRAVVDGCSSVGGVAVPRLLRALGATVSELDCVPDGRFTRELEPLPEHLDALGRAVRENDADFGVALDPDADRAAFVDHLGVPLGEEYTVALGSDVALGTWRGPLVTNLSTSRIIDAVAAHHGVPVHRSPVGEAHVVAEMRARGAVAGGEGNGGMILPSAHYGRDGLVAVALVAQALAGGGTLREKAGAWPPYRMLKEKAVRGDEPWERAAGRLRDRFRDHELDERDGLRFSRDEEWVHVRASGTEPVVRIIAESLDEARSRALIDEARAALDAGGPGRR